MTARARPALLILEDWGLAALSDEGRRDLLALLEDRPARRAPLGTSQLPVEPWHEARGAPPLAAALLARLVHHAYQIALRGDSRRKRAPKGPPQAVAE